MNLANFNYERTQANEGIKHPENYENNNNNKMKNNEKKYEV